MGIVRHRESPHLLTILKKPSSAASAGSLSRPVWPVPATVSPCSKLFAAEKKSAATTLVPAAQARNTKSAAAQTPDFDQDMSPLQFLFAAVLCGFAHFAVQALRSPNGKIRTNHCSEPKRVNLVILRGNENPAIHNRRRSINVISGLIDP